MWDLYIHQDPSSIELIYLLAWLWLAHTILVSRLTNKYHLNLMSSFSCNFFNKLGLSLCCSNYLKRHFFFFSLYQELNFLHLIYFLGTYWVQEEIHLHEFMFLKLQSLFPVFFSLDINSYRPVCSYTISNWAIASTCIGFFFLFRWLDLKVINFIYKLHF